MSLKSILFNHPYFFAGYRYKIMSPFSLSHDSAVNYAAISAGVFFLASNPLILHHLNDMLPGKNIISGDNHCLTPLGSVISTALFSTAIYGIMARVNRQNPEEKRQTRSSMVKLSIYAGLLFFALSSGVAYGLTQPDAGSGCPSQLRVMCHSLAYFIASLTLMKL